MEQNITYDDNVARLVATHPTLFTRVMPAYSDLAPGWYAIVDRLCTDIERELGPGMTKRFAIEQIKEKFGTLRFYWRLGDRSDTHVDVLRSGGTVQSNVVKAKPSRAADAELVDRARDRLRELVEAACEASAGVCQRCGAPGSLRRLPWVQTLCPPHFSEVEERVVRDASGSVGR